MQPESEELFALYLQLQSADSQFLELIGEDLERKQQVLAVRNQSSAWLKMAKLLQGQTEAFSQGESGNALN